MTLLVVALFALATAWALAVPFNGFPDELDHYVRAAGIASGQLVGEPLPAMAGVPAPTEKSCCDESPAKVYWVQVGIRVVPVAAGREANQVPCSAATDAGGRVDCTHPGAGAGEPQQTTMGTIEPAAYLLPAAVLRLVPDASRAYRLARLADAWLAVAVVSLVLIGCARGEHVLRRVAGLTLAATPMVLFVVSSGSPSAFETAGAVGTWLGVVELVAPRATGGRAPRVLWVGTIAAALLLATSRSLGPVWLVTILAVALVWRGRAALVGAVRADRLPALVGVVVVGLGALSTIVWELLVQPRVPVDLRFARAQLGPALSDIAGVTHESIGGFGALDVFIPFGFVVAWVGAVLATAAAGVVTGTTRGRVTLVLLFVGCVVGILVVDVGIMRQNGFTVQGRHLLPLFVGLPIVATDVVRRSPGSSPWLSARLVRGLVVALGVAAAVVQVVALVEIATSYDVHLGPLTVAEPFAGTFSAGRSGVPLALGVLGALALGAGVALVARATATTPDEPARENPAVVAGSDR